MKEKITVLFTIVFLSALIWHYQMRVPGENAQDQLEDFSKNQEEVNTETVMNDIEIPDQVELESMDVGECEATVVTDLLSFNEAFRHYHNCLGTDEIFAWKGNQYKIDIAPNPLNVVDTSTPVPAKNKHQESPKQTESLVTR